MTPTWHEPKRGKEMDRAHAFDGRKAVCGRWVKSREGKPAKLAPRCVTCLSLTAKIRVTA